MPFPDPNQHLYSGGISRYGRGGIGGRGGFCPEKCWQISTGVPLDGSWNWIRFRALPALPPLPFSVTSIQIPPSSMLQEITGTIPLFALPARANSPGSIHHRYPLPTASDSVHALVSLYRFILDASTLARHNRTGCYPNRAAICYFLFLAAFFFAFVTCTQLHSGPS